MGAWGAGAFENDDGSDFIYAAEADPAGVIAETLDRVAAVPGDEELGATDASCAVAAAALVAARHKNLPSGAFNEDGDEWLDSFPFDVSDELRAVAATALARVRASGELVDLWDEQEQLDEFHDSLDAILANLS